MILGSPVKGAIGLTVGSARWYRSQAFGCTGFPAEPPLGNCKNYHRGIDISRGPAGCGEDLLAVAPGTVIYAGTLIGGSKSVVIRHAGGVATGQSHMSSIGVKAGAKVKAGQRIGAMGRTGNATGCHVHLAYKTGFPVSGDVNDFYLDKVGKWADAWPQLAQNVTVHLKELDAINIRTGASTVADKYASTAGGHIIRISDKADLGPQSQERDWRGTVTGGAYTLDGKVGNTWEAIGFPDGVRYCASPLAVLSAR